MVDEVLARSFEGIGTDYDRYRPGFPADAVTAIVPGRVRVALDLGAGTGKFTELLRGRAERVIAVDPSLSMLDVLRGKLPDVECLQGTAERIPVADGAVDVVTVAQAFHWFDREPACAEIARSLVPGGTLGLLWNHPHPGCAWDRACHRIVHPAAADVDATTSAAGSHLPGFDLQHQSSVLWTERITRERYLRRWSTVSTFLVADEGARTTMSAALEDVLDRDPATCGFDVFDLPQVTDVFVYRRR